MKTTTDWTESDRLAVCGKIGLEMYDCRNTKNWVDIESIIEWAERLLYTVNMPKEYLEANRINIVTGNRNIKAHKTIWDDNGPEK